MAVSRIMTAKSAEGAGDRYVEKIFDLTANQDQNTNQSLSLFWEDPDFDPAVPAVYYVRVVETPTPLQGRVFNKNPQYDPPADAPRTTQERGWSSPVWYWPANRK
jgi:hypothetical protein